MEHKSKFADLYKTSICPSEQQTIRRQQLLDGFKQQRQQLADDNRQIKQFLKRLKKKRYCNEKYKDQLQHSEWFRERPEDLENWFLVPCPIGKRCLVVAEAGTTKVYSKIGTFMFKYRSMLPGGGTLSQQVTILDCIFVKKLEKIYVLDAIVFGNQDLINCDVAFRFFWIKSQLHENNLMNIHRTNEYPLIPLEFYDMNNEESVMSCFTKYPHWENEEPMLDGFLFYHKESGYVQGVTPLVGWLFAFMVPEVLGYSIHEKYMETKPKDYVDYLHYITVFDEKELKRRERYSKTHNEVMDHETNLDDNTENECEFDDVVEKSRLLEMEDPTDDYEHVD